MVKFFQTLNRLFLSSKRIGCRYFSKISNGNSGVLTVNVLGNPYQGIIVLGLNRPEAKNALNKSLTYSLDDVVESVRFDKATKVVILRSEVPGVFCAGADLKERLTLTETEVQIFVSRLRNLMNKIENLPMPVIAAIDGVALGGGLEMALSADIRIASESVTLGLVETRLAILPGAGGTQRLPRIIGPSKAKELIFTARTFSGKEAQGLGVVNHCVKDNDNKDSAYQRALEIAKEILPNGPVGIKMAKIAINKGTQVDQESGLTIEKLCYDQVIPTKDRMEGLKAFREKRKPIYIGE